MRFVVRFRTGGRDTPPSRRTLPTRDAARALYRLLLKADAAGWPTGPDGLPAADPVEHSLAAANEPPAVQRTSPVEPARLLAPITFADYVKNVFWPANEPEWMSSGNERGIQSHAGNLDLAAELLVYRDGDHRLRPGIRPGDSIWLHEMTTDDVQLAIAGRASKNAATERANAREVARAREEGRAPVLIRPKASKTTIRNFEVSLRMVLRSAIVANRAPAELLPPADRSRRRRSRPPAKIQQRHVHSPHEVRRIADAVCAIGPLDERTGLPHGARYKAMIMFAGFEPVRPGEVIAIPPDAWELDTDAPVVRLPYSEGVVTRRFTSDGKTRQRKSLKHRDDEEDRLLPLLPEVAAAIREHLAAGYASETHTFTSPKGRPVDLHNFGREYWRPACEAAFAGTGRADLVTRPFKWLRKTAITYWLVHLKRPVHQVAYYAGVTPKVILAAYAGTEEPDPRIDAANLARAAGNGRS